MSIRVPRNAEKDVPFSTKNAPGGSKVDQYNWTNGLTHAQWPVVTYHTLPNGAGTDVTSQVVKDITSTTITSATHKDPTGTTGVWRKNIGTYRSRVQPSNALALGVYYMHVVHEPTAGNLYPEDHEFEIIAAGDTVFGDDIISVDEVTAGISTSLDDEDVQDLITEATEWVAGKAWAWCRVDIYTLSGDDPRLTIARNAVRLYARKLIFGLDAGAFHHTGSVKEGDTTLYFAGQGDKTSQGYLDEALDAMKDFCGLGMVRRPTMKVVRQRPENGAW